MTNIQNLIVASKNGCFVKVGITEKDDVLVWMPNFDSAFEFLKKKLLKGLWNDGTSEGRKLEIFHS